VTKNISENGGLAAEIIGKLKEIGFVLKLKKLL
jgi:hypothetical protein